MHSTLGIGAETISNITPTGPATELYRTRRIIGSVVLALGCIAQLPNVDSVSGYVRWHDNTSNVLTLDDTYALGTGEASVTFPGWGQKDGRRIAQALDPVLSPIGPETYLSYPDNGFTGPGTYAEIARKLTSRLKEYGAHDITINAQSMGAAIFLNALRYIPDDIHIKRLILDCSPPSIQETRQAKALADAWLLQHHHYGLVSAIPATIAHEMLLRKNNSLSTFAQLKESVRISITGTSPELMKSQYDELLDFRFDDYMRERLKDTRLVMVMPDNAASDTVVDVTAALQKWEEYFGRPIQVLRVPNGEHASPTTRPGEYNQTYSILLQPNLG